MCRIFFLIQMKSMTSIVLILCLRFISFGSKRNTFKFIIYFFVIIFYGIDIIYQFLKYENIFSFEKYINSKSKCNIIFFFYVSKSVLFHIYKKFLFCMIFIIKIIFYKFSLISNCNINNGNCIYYFID